MYIYIKIDRERDREREREIHIVYVYTRTHARTHTHTHTHTHRSLPRAQSATGTDLSRVISRYSSEVLLETCLGQDCETEGGREAGRERVFYF